MNCKSPHGFPYMKNKIKQKEVNKKKITKTLAEFLGRNKQTISFRMVFFAFSYYTQLSNSTWDVPKPTIKWINPRGKMVPRLIIILIIICINLQKNKHITGKNILYKLAFLLSNSWQTNNDISKNINQRKQNLICRCF